MGEAGRVAVIGVDCGGTSVRAGRVGLDHVIDERTDAPTPAREDDLTPLIAEMCESLEPFRAIGVGAAGLVDPETGDLVWMPHMGGGTPLRAELEEATGRLVVVDNDANVAALAEASVGAGAGHRMVLMVTVGTGIGAGLVIDGRIERGRGHLGEVGHIPMDPGGPVCSCGLAGCWESLASGSALDRAAAALVSGDPSGATARAAGADEPAGRHLVTAVRQGDAAASAALSEVASWFGRGLGALVAIFDPDVIVIGGGVGDAGPVFLEPALRSMDESVSGAAVRRTTPVVPARFGVRAGMIGAAMLARAASA
jgi:glucokinase